VPTVTLMLSDDENKAMVDKVHGLGLGRSLVMSTGVIGPFLPMGKINAGIESAASGVCFA